MRPGCPFEKELRLIRDKWRVGLLIAGALHRRMVQWKANVLQAAVFLLPHLLILLVAPEQWWSLILIVGVLGLVSGWLRMASGSVWPAVLVHGGANTVVGLLYAAGVY